MIRVRRSRWGITLRGLARPRPGPLGDTVLVAAAATAAAGAWWARPWPRSVLIAAIGLTVVGTLLRRVPLGLAGLFVVTATLAGQAWSGAAPRAPAPFDRVVTLRTDPAPLGAGRVAEAVGGTDHVELHAFGGGGRRLSAWLAGQQVHVVGRLRHPGPASAGRLRARHIVGVVDVERLDLVGDGTPLARSANRIRQALDRGARTMTPLDRSLYLGFVVGDDRDQPPAVVDQFRDAGLSHLTAVSGENVAFMLAVADPLLRRLRPSTRWGARSALIGWFAVLTRFEPSVLRATVMAGLATTGAATGRRAGQVRLLSLAVVITLLLDPLLVRAVGWWLSVGATAGIAVLAAPLAARLPGPAPVRAALAVTIAAQLGVAPVSVAVFGPLPLASVPANLLAVPAAGPVMIYGLPAGLLAAVVPTAVATVIQLPTVLLVRWIAHVAAWTSAWPLPELGPGALASAAVAVALVLRRPARHRVGRPGRRGA